jgi:hypothetical protein
LRPVEIGGLTEVSEVTIKLTKVADDLYYVTATAAQWRGGQTWSSSEPLHSNQIAQELVDRGFFVQDICDALFEQDPKWVERSQDNSRNS